MDYISRNMRKTLIVFEDNERTDQPEDSRSMVRIFIVRIQNYLIFRLQNYLTVYNIMTNRENTHQTAFLSLRFNCITTSATEL